MFIRANDDHTNSREPDPSLDPLDQSPPLICTHPFCRDQSGLRILTFLRKTPYVHVSTPTFMRPTPCLRIPYAVWAYARARIRRDESAPSKISTQIPRYSLMWLLLIELSHLASSPLPLSLTFKYNGRDAKNYIPLYIVLFIHIIISFR